MLSGAVIASKTKPSAGSSDGAALASERLAASAATVAAIFSRVMGSRRRSSSPARPFRPRTASCSPARRDWPCTSRRRPRHSSRRSADRKRDDERDDEYRGDAGDCKRTERCRQPVPRPPPLSGAIAGRSRPYRRGEAGRKVALLGAGVGFQQIDQTQLGVVGARAVGTFGEVRVDVGIVAGGEFSARVIDETIGR